MRRCSFRSFLLSVALLASAACGGVGDVQTRTVTVDGAQYELIAYPGSELSAEEVQSLLARAIVGPTDELAEALDLAALSIEVVPHDASAAPLSVVAFTAEQNEEKAEEPEEESRTHRSHFVSRGDVKGATDPDVDPAQPY